MKRSHITITDQFCGAGGSSQGVRALYEKYNGGIEVSTALNHWKLAIDTHSTNFPKTQHYCTDISACDPRRFPTTTGSVMSPECTVHTPAGGNTYKALKSTMDLFDSGKADAAAERSRATMWDVCRFAEFHKYEFIIVENVVEAKTSWPLFDDWLRCMGTLGYNHKCCYLNSMHFWPTPQSRDRMYIVFWKKGNKAPNLDYTPVAHCPQCEKNVSAIQVFKNQSIKHGKYKKQYLYRCPVHGCIVEPYYYAAFNCIDWTDLGKRIGDREKPLAPNTVKRVNYGLDKYGDEPFIFHTMYSDQARGVVRSVHDAAFAQTSFTSQAIGIPFIIDDKQTTGVNFRVRNAFDTTNTIHTDPRLKLAIPALPFITQAEQTSNAPIAKKVTGPLDTQKTRQTFGICTPFVVDGNFDAKASRSSSVMNELPTQPTHQRNGIAFPLIVDNHGTSLSKPASEPLPGVTTVNTNSLLSSEAFNSFISAFNSGSHCTTHISESCGSVATKERLMINTKPQLEDCYYRMLKAGEIKLAMAFNKDYIILGSGKDQVKQCGNAVTPPVMEWLTDQCVQSLN
jgi:DNA (cytosine-5)-methyltransferase 1